MLFDEEAGLLQGAVLAPAEDVAALEEEEFVEDSSGCLDEGFLEAFADGHSVILNDSSLPAARAEFLSITFQHEQSKTRLISCYLQVENV